MNISPIQPLDEEKLAALWADLARRSYNELDRGPLPAVLDTACIRTGLHFQMTNGCPPRSVTTARTGSLRLFMEYDTLVEASERLPRFAKQLKVPVAELRRVLDEDWLPHIEVVRVPSAMRRVDPRALAVRALDADDYPAAALAALLSPCILLTHNYRDFGALGILSKSQGVDGVLALVEINVGQAQVQAVVTLPTLPVRAIGATARWASEQLGPAAWVILGSLAVGGIFFYLKQSKEGQERIKRVAGDVGMAVLQQYGQSVTKVELARAHLRACVVPKPEIRSSSSAVLRELAISQKSLSAQQLADLIDPSLRPSVTDLRAYLRANNKVLFTEVRRGGFTLGRHYTLSELPE